MKLNDFMKEVHENAVAHGWWETDRSFAECIVLIHSEWSEALEEARAGRPLVWYDKRLIQAVPTITVPKPEGIAVELMDGVIRILDLHGKYGESFDSGTVRSLSARINREYTGLKKDMSLADALAWIHYLTSLAWNSFQITGDRNLALPLLEVSAGIAIWWVQQQGLDPEKLLREKHEYNKTRPYKHGKKF